VLERQGTLVRFLACTGLRWGEVVALHVREVDSRRRVSIVEKPMPVGGRIVGTPKPHHARRVPIPPFLAGELAEQCRGKSASALVFGDGVRHLN
jgi:integrase